MTDRWRRMSAACVFGTVAVLLVGCAPDAGVDASELARSSSARDGVPRMLRELDTSPPSGYELSDERVKDECGAVTADQGGLDDRHAIGYQCVHITQFLLLPSAEDAQIDPSIALGELADRWGEDAKHGKIYYEVRLSGKPAKARVAGAENQNQLRDELRSEIRAGNTVIEETEFGNDVANLTQANLHSSLLMTVSLRYFRYIDPMED